MLSTFDNAILTIVHFLIYFSLVCYVIWIIISVFIITWDSLRIRRIPPPDFFYQGIRPFLAAPIIIPLFFSLWVYSLFEKK